MSAIKERNLGGHRRPNFDRKGEKGQQHYKLFFRKANTTIYLGIDFARKTQKQARKSSGFTVSIATKII